MKSQYALIAISCSLTFTILVGCGKKPIAIYVNQNLTLNGYAEPGQVLEWRVSSPQSPSFRFKPQPGLCTESREQTATYGHAARCVIAEQHYPEGAQENIYFYELKSTQHPGHSEEAAVPDSAMHFIAPPPVPPSQIPFSGGVFTQRVGSCGACLSKKSAVDPGTSGLPQPPAGPPDPVVSLICNGAQLVIQQNPQPAVVGSSITWLATQGRVRDFTVQFGNNGVCVSSSMNATHNNCTVQNVPPGSYSYTANLYRNNTHSSENLICAGNGSVTIQ